MSWMEHETGYVHEPPARVQCTGCFLWAEFPDERDVPDRDFICDRCQDDRAVDHKADQRMSDVDDDREWSPF